MPGLPGEPGTEGIGIPGPKVCIHLFFRFFAFVSVYGDAHSSFDNFMSVSG